MRFQTAQVDQGDTGWGNTGAVLLCEGIIPSSASCRLMKSSRIRSRAVEPTVQCISWLRLSGAKLAYLHVRLATFLIATLVMSTELEKIRHRVLALFPIYFVFYQMLPLCRQCSYFLFKYICIENSVQHLWHNCRQM